MTFPERLKQVTHRFVLRVQDGHPGLPVTVQLLSELPA